MKALPHIITLLNMLFGSIAVVLAVLNRLEWAALFFCLGVLCDFLDGLVARALGQESELGVQLDSLADMITSGLLPGIFMCQLLGMAVQGGWNMESFFIGFSDRESGLATWLPLVGLLITLASGLRLARFNIDENQVQHFKGLPTPANAAWIISLPLILMYQGSESVNAVILSPWLLVGLTLLSAYLLNSNLNLFALKFKDWSFKASGMKYIFLFLSLVLIITLKYLAVPLVVLLYVLFSIGSAKRPSTSL